MNHKLLTHKKYESNGSSTVLTFNNDADQQLSLCVDNFEQYVITVELEIKFGVHLGDTDITPTKNVIFLFFIEKFTVLNLFLNFLFIMVFFRFLISFFILLLFKFLFYFI